MTNTGPGDQGTPPNSVTMSPRSQLTQLQAQGDVQMASGLVGGINALAAEQQLVQSGLPLSSAHGGGITRTGVLGPDMGGLAAGFQGFIQSEAAAQREALDRIQESQMAAERTAQYLADATNKLLTVSNILSRGTQGPQQATAVVPTAWVATGQVTQSPKAASGGGAPPERPPTSTGGSSGPPGDRPPRRRRRDVPEGIPEPTTTSTSDAYSDAADAAGDRYDRMRRGFSLSDVRRQAAGRAAHWFENRNPNPGWTQTAEGAVLDEAGNAVGAEEAAGWVNSRSWMKMGQNVFTTVANAPEGGVFRSLSSVLGGEAAAGAGTSAGAFAGAAGMGIGAAAAGLVSFQKTTNFFRSQADANREYQRVLGGGQGEAMSQRFASVRTGLGALFDPMGMGAGQRRELREGLLREGFRDGSGMGAAQDFGATNFKQYGMNAQETLALLDVNASRGMRTLNGLAESLDKVTRAARQSGVAADTARQQFTRVYTDLAAQAGAGAGTAAVAGAISTFQAQNPLLAGANFEGLLTSQTGDLALAARTGQTLAQVQTSRFTDPAARFAGGEQVAFQQAGIALPNSRNVVNEFMRRNRLSSGATVSRGQVQALGTELMKGGGAVNIEDVQTLAGQYGIQFNNPQEAYTWMANELLTQGTGMSTEVSAAQRAVAPTMLNRGERRDVASTLQALRLPGTPSTALTFGAARSTVGRGDVLPGMKGGSGQSAETTQFNMWGGSLDRKEYGEYLRTLYPDAGEGTAEGRYARAAQATGIQSPYVEWALKNGGDKMKFQVRDKQGALREVSFKEAVRSYYDQLVTGQATVSKGQGKGLTLGQASGLGDLTGDQYATVQSTISGATGTAASYYSGESKGKSVGKEVSGDKAEGTTRVLVQPTPELARLLRFIPQGDPRYAASSRGVVPSTSGPIDTRAP